FFVGVDIEALFATVFQYNFLVLEIDSNNGLRICIDSLEYRCEESIRYLAGEQCVVQCIVLENISKEAGYYYAETTVDNCPGGVFAATATTKVFSGDKNLAGVRWIVEDEIFRIALAIIAPIAKEVFTETFAGCCLQKAGRNDLVSVNIFDRQGHCLAFQDCEFLFAHKLSS